MLSFCPPSTTLMSVIPVTELIYVILIIIYINTHDYVSKCICSSQKPRKDRFIISSFWTPTLMGFHLLLLNLNANSEILSNIVSRFGFKSYKDECVLEGFTATSISPKRRHLSIPIHCFLPDLVILYFQLKQVKF
jgi:hypothetical protein